MKHLDFIGAIELAYDRTRDEIAWLEEFTRFVAPAFSVGAPTTSFFFELVGDRAKVGGIASVGDKPYTREDYQRLQDEGPTIDASSRAGYECEVFTVLSRVLGVKATSRLMRSARMSGIDAVGLRANVTPESGILLTTHVPGGFRLREKELWLRVAAHLGCALRLRRSHATSTPDFAAGVLDARGRLEHGTEPTIAARRHLADSAKAMERARGKLRRLDPEAASELWRTMVRGQWSLVDWMDRDGKRFILAHDNQVPLVAEKSLTAREKQVVAFAAMGHSNKLIAYDMGLSLGTVSVLLARAAKKLGVSGRVALIRASASLSSK